MRTCILKPQILHSTKSQPVRLTAFIVSKFYCSVNGQPELCPSTLSCKLLPGLLRQKNPNIESSLWYKITVVGNPLYHVSSAVGVPIYFLFKKLFKKEEGSSTSVVRLGAERVILPETLRTKIHDQ